MMNGLSFIVVGAASNQAELLYVWDRATLEAKAIIVLLIVFSIVVWSVMVYKAVQMRRARRLNYYFNEEFRSQKKVLDIFDRKLQVEGCPLYEVYQTGCVQLLAAGSWQELATLEEGVPLCFSPDGGKLALYSVDSRMVLVWDLRLVRRQLAAMGLDWGTSAPVPENGGGFRARR